MAARQRALGAIAVAALIAACSGSTETPPEPSTESLIRELCDKQAAVSCATPQTKQQCLDELETRQGYAKQESCGAELHQYVNCANAGSITCGGYDGELHPQVDEKCESLNQAFWDCYTWLTDDTCGVGVGYPSGPDVSCSIKCPSLSSLCHGPDPNGPVTCACDGGPNVGAAFQATDCGMGLIWATGHHCS